jgi:hypothetical protein
MSGLVKGFYKNHPFHPLWEGNHFIKIQPSILSILSIHSRKQLFYTNHSFHPLHPILRRQLFYKNSVFNSFHPFHKKTIILGVCQTSQSTAIIFGSKCDGGLCIWTQNIQVLDKTDQEWIQEEDVIQSYSTNRPKNTETFRTKPITVKYRGGDAMQSYSMNSNKK